ncbi:MAG: SMC-Scp complex subunit ScpB [Ardenticatenaceae bacterium]
MNETPRNSDSEATEELARILEAILFVADQPVSLPALTQVTGSTTAEIEDALEHLSGTLQRRSLRLQHFRDSVQFVTAPAYSSWVERFLRLDLSSKLSAAALETLAIIAYRQPVTRAEIDAIRGVNSSGTLRTLIQRELIEEVGRRDTVGNPYLYATTPTFLQYFGITTLEELPPVISDA